MNDKQIECFLLTATTLSFRKAADQLYITQPGVSHLIKSLETELGFPLFTREHNRIALTAAGENFYRNMLPAFTSINDAVESSRRIASDQVRRTISLWNPKMSVESISELIRLHHDSGASYDLAFSSDSPIPPTTILRSGAADLACCIEEDIPLDTGKFRFVIVCQLRDFCIMRKDHPLSTLPQVEFKDLHNQVIVQNHRENLSRSYARLLENIVENVPSVSLKFFEDDDYANATILAGGGIGIEPLPPDGTYHREGLVAIPFKEGGRYTLGLCYLVEKESLDMQHLISLVRRVV